MDELTNGLDAVNNCAFALGLGTLGASGGRGPPESRQMEPWRPPGTLDGDRRTRPASGHVGQNSAPLVCGQWTCSVRLVSR
jgi:hypothetical protein